MEEITYEKVELIDVISKIGGLYKLLTTFLYLFSGIVFSMFIVHL